jgi:dTDP-glucose 4,6-dehydratase
MKTTGKRVLVTGGAGFIGSNFIHYILNKYDDYEIVNFDKLTYAGNLENLADIQDDKRYRFIRGDICDREAVAAAIKDADIVVNFAAESHVDRSIEGPGSFIQTDVFGTFVLLEASRNNEVSLYVQISTDEVYGSIENGSFKETDPLKPNSPYSASKAGADMVVRSFNKTYGLPTIITRSSNNFGPNQYPEKVIPLFVTNLIDDIPVPLYGDGMNVRDWIYIEDNCAGIDFVMHKGKAGEIYNIGGGNERPNIWITRKILEIMGKPESMIKYVKDRPGHDRRYSVDCDKLKSLGWNPRYDFESALERTIMWYQQNEKWWRKLKR